MTKITLNKTAAATSSATEQATAKASLETIVHDARGRAITLRKPQVLAQYRLIEVLGDAAANDTYVQMVVPLLYVSAIDGEPTIPFAKKSQVEAMIQQLDEEGIDAVMKGVAEHFGAPDPEATKAALKN